MSNVSIGQADVRSVAMTMNNTQDTRASNDPDDARANDRQSSARTSDDQNNIGPNNNQENTRTQQLPTEDSIPSPHMYWKACWIDIYTWLMCP